MVSTAEKTAVDDRDNVIISNIARLGDAGVFRLQLRLVRG